MFTPTLRSLAFLTSTDHSATKDHIELHAELLGLFQEEQGLSTLSWLVIVQWAPKVRSIKWQSLGRSPICSGTFMNSQTLCIVQRIFHDKRPKPCKMLQKNKSLLDVCWFPDAPTCNHCCPFSQALAAALYPTEGSVIDLCARLQAIWKYLRLV